MAETTFERAVKAVALSDGFTAKELSTMRGDPRLDPTPEYEAIVRAVLQAIREPDEETVVALVTAPLDFGDHSGGNLARSWRAAIDSILSQSQEGKHP